MRRTIVRDRYGNRRLLLLIVLFVAALLPLVLSLNVWQDETYSLRTTSGDFAHAFRSAIVFEGLPPFYPLLLEGWRSLDRSVVFARLLSVLFAAATIWCGWLFAKRALPNVPPLAFAFALAADPFLIYAALDIRLYALAILLSGLLFLTFFAGFFTDRPSRRAQFAHALLAIVGMYTQYFIGALLLGFFIALVLARRRGAIGAYAILGFVVTLASLPIATFLREQLATFRTTSAVVHYSAASVLVTAFTFALPHDWLPQWTHGAGNTMYWIALAAIAVAALVAKPRFGAVLGALATIAFVVVVFFLTVPIALHQTLIVPRHLAVLLFPVLALVFGIFDRLRAGRDRAIAVYLCAYAIFAVLAFVSTYARDAKPGDFKHVAAFLEANERPGQTIYVYDQEMTTPLSYYYRGPNAVVGLPEPQNFDRFDARQFVLHDTGEVRAKLAAVRSGATIWLYKADLCTDRSDPFGCRYLDQVVREDYDVVLDRSFYEATLRELVRRGNRTPAK